MVDGQAACPWKFLVPLSSPSCLASPSHGPSLGSSSTSFSPQRKRFPQALGNACDVPYSQLPRPCIKGEEISVKIHGGELIVGLEGCKNHLHGRLVLSKGDSPLKVQDLWQKLSLLWKPLDRWGLISLGKGY